MSFLVAASVSTKSLTPFPSMLELAVREYLRTPVDWRNSFHVLSGLEAEQECRAEFEAEARAFLDGIAEDDDANASASDHEEWHDPYFYYHSDENEVSDGYYYMDWDDSRCYSDSDSDDFWGRRRL